MTNIEKTIEELQLDNNISLEDIPNIDLYMDQVIQLFEKNFAGAKRSAEDKVLTKTMINNYAKGNLFFPVKNKKYTKDHIILISMIYQMKGALSINDIKKTLAGINEIVKEENREEKGDLDSFYNSYLNLTTNNAQLVKKDMNNRLTEVKKELEPLKDDRTRDYKAQVLLIASLVNISNAYRKAAEKLVDQLVDD